MADLLSQDEIDALLGDDDSNGSSDSDKDKLNSEQKDTIGEMGNISMGTAATTLSSLLDKKVGITTPNVSVLDFNKLLEDYKKEEYISVKIDYKEGLKGSSVLFLKTHDVRVIASLMMNEDNEDVDEGELTDLHLSAVSEAMNQMIGSACTSLSSMLNVKIDIKPPSAKTLDIEEVKESKLGLGDEKLVKISFDMKIGDLVDSKMIQILPLSFAKTMTKLATADKESINKDKKEEKKPKKEAANDKNLETKKESDIINEKKNKVNNVTAKPAQFNNFDDSQAVSKGKSSIDIIKDVDLDVTVELGKTVKKIKEVLAFNVGTIIELDKVSGEPIDILVNGKRIAKGEVVVVDENFAIRITEIKKLEERF